MTRGHANTYHASVARVSPQTKVRRIERVPFSQLDDECLAIDVASSSLYSLNETGRRVWDALVVPAAVSDVVGELVAVFDVDEATCEREVIALVNALCDAGFVEVVDESR